MENTKATLMAVKGVITGAAKGCCEIYEYIGVACNRPAKQVWGYGALINVCELHAHLKPDASREEMLAQLQQLQEA